MAKSIFSWCNFLPADNQATKLFRAKKVKNFSILQYVKKEIQKKK